MAIERETGEGESSPLFAELLRQNHQMAEPLARFLVRQTETPELAVLIRLLGKCMDQGKIAILLQFLESEEPALRRSAANALGWNRTPSALETLGKMEQEDPDEGVRYEARAAVDEILRQYPAMGQTLKNHEPIEPSEPQIAAQYDEVPSEPDEHQHFKLMASLPRLLAVKYEALPLHFSPNDQLHMAVPHGSEKRMMAALSDVTGHHVRLHGWPPDQVMAGIEKFYHLGDDDFCTFHDQLTPVARGEVVQRVMAGVNPAEPVCPLDEVNDAVEAAQVFLAHVAALRATKATIVYTPPEMLIEGRQDGEVFSTQPPTPANRERFMDALRILAGLDPGAGISRQHNGRLECANDAEPFLAEVDSEKTLEHDRLRLTFHYGKPEDAE